MPTPRTPLPRAALRAVRKVQQSATTAGRIISALRDHRIANVPAALDDLARLLLSIEQQSAEAELHTMRSINPLTPHVADPVHYREPDTGRIVAATVIAIVGDATDEVVNLSVFDPDTGQPYVVRKVPHGTAPGQWDWRDE